MDYKIDLHAQTCHQKQQYKVHCGFSVLNHLKYDDWQCVIISRRIKPSGLRQPYHGSVRKKMEILFLDRNKNNHHERVGVKLSIEGCSPLGSTSNACQPANDALRWIEEQH